MTYEDLRKVNENLSTMPIKEKDYVLVNSRVMAFRELFPEGTITTELLSNENGVCVMKAYVYNGQSLLATGLAYEKESSSYINKTSYIENCETSAVGRALGFLGIGITTSIASAEEMQNAVNNQQEATVENKHIYVFQKKCKEKGVDPNDYGKKYNLKKVTDMTMKQFREIMDDLESK